VARFRGFGFFRLGLLRGLVGVTMNTLPEFVRAYESDGMPSAEFISFGPTGAL
jgi:hypothetical protein